MVTGTHTVKSLAQRNYFDYISGKKEVDYATNRSFLAKFFPYGKTKLIKCLKSANF